MECPPFAAGRAPGPRRRFATAAAGTDRHAAGGLPGHHDTSFGEAVIGQRDRDGEAHAGDLPCRQQRHAASAPPPARWRASGRWRSAWQGNGWAQNELVGPGLPRATVRPGRRPDTALRSGIAHTNAANVPDLRRRFVAARCRPASPAPGRWTSSATYLGATVTREWMRRDGAQRLVRHFGRPSTGPTTASSTALVPNPANVCHCAAFGGFTPKSEMRRGSNSPNTRFLKLLSGPGSMRRGDRPETPGAGDPAADAPAPSPLPAAGRRLPAADPGRGTL